MSSTERDEGSVDSAIRKVLAEIQSPDPSDDAGRKQQQLLSKLLAELESLKANGSEVGSESLISEDHIVEDKDVGAGGSNIAIEEVTKELKIVKKQNLVTHCLLSALLVVTLVWQLSEVSLILSVKDGLSHPLRGLKGKVTSFLKRRGVVISKQDEDEGRFAEDGGSVDDVSLPTSDLTLPY